MERIQTSFWLAALALMGWTGCYHECTTQIPRCAFDLTLAHGSWEEGDYEFEFRRDGTSVVCTAQLPLAGDEGFACDDGGKYFDDYFYTPPEHNRPFPHTISFFSPPEQAEVVIRRNGGELAEPNGEGCGICENAADTLSF